MSWFKIDLSRVGRLCLKELRESLRDRRTIVTLVLMPLLVYPLLSLVLNRVLLSGAVLKDRSGFTIGIAAELKDSAISNVLGLGLSLSKDPESAPAFVLQTVPEQISYRPPGSSPDLDNSDEDVAVNLSQESGENGEPRVSIAAADAAAERQRMLEDSSKQEIPQLIVLADDGVSALASGSVDVVITGREPLLDDGAGQAVISMFQSIAEASGSDFNPNAALALLGTYDLKYRRGDQQSERALQLVERMLAAVNNEAARGLAGGRFDAPFRLRASPVRTRGNYSDLLATMVPLVLVLMTMAGAVYPAIDLTAGERERGTMEAMIVSPTSGGLILFAKYSAVVTVALLTAIANLTAMSITLWVSGLGTMVFGEGSLTASMIVVVLALLVLFTMFFAALLLVVTSFARSFKEAQAYLIPLMLLALAPGVMSLLPGIEFSGILATVPLVNIVLLARQVLIGNVDWNAASVAIVCNGFYAAAALAVASKLFGTDASLSGSQGSWQDAISRPMKRLPKPRLDHMALLMAGMFPAYFVASSLLPSISDDIQTKLWASAAVSFALILFLPVMFAVNRRINLRETFLLRMPAPGSTVLWIAAVPLIGFAAWMFAHEILLIAKNVGIGSIGEEQMEAVAEFRDRLQQIPLWVVLSVFAITPAVCEEFLFRGFVLSSLHRMRPVSAVLTSAVLFGLMHVLTSNVLAVERFLPSTFMGIVLGYVAVRTRSLLPGIAIHALHNGFLLSVSHNLDWIKQFGILVVDQEHLPLAWLVGGGISLALGLALFALAGQAKPQSEK